MKRILAGCLTGLLMLISWVFASSESADIADAETANRTAAEIRTGITFSGNGKSENFQDMQDDDFGTYYPLKDKKGWLEVHCEEEIYGIYLMQFEKITVPLSYDLQIPDGNGEWKTVAQGGQYLTHWHPLAEGVHEFRISATSRERIRIAELRLYGKGEKPREVQNWQSIEKCDLMLLTGHPDDEILWFAGLLPTYAGERNLRVQLAVMAPTGGERKLELLHAIWHCGVTAYPEFIGLVDKNGKTVEGQYQAWKGKNRVLGLVTEVIRKHQPEVMVTHGERGEYGHGAHRTACAAAKECVKLAAKKNRFPKTANKYGVWQVKKLYLHEYKKNIIPCDWTVPLKAFGGKTGFEVAEEAFAFHRSQVKRNWSFEAVGPHDNTLFGLFYTTVGPDTGTGDFMEHIE